MFFTIESGINAETTILLKCTVFLNLTFSEVSTILLIGVCVVVFVLHRRYEEHAIAFDG